MNLKNMPIEELEIMSYTDLAYKLLKENKKPLNTPTIFKQICDLLNMSEESYAEKIGDFYTSLTTDKRFVMLESAEWDIRDNHIVEVIVDDDDEEEEEEEELDEESDIEEEDSNIDDDIDELDDDDDMDDLNLIDEDEMEEE